MGNGHIFISYRWDDTAGYARAIYDQLVERFSKERVFMDVDAIEPGLPFDEAVQRAVGGCEILLALIGRRWMEPQAGGGLRINEPTDFVRAEIAAALSRNVRVIPVLLDGATMPAAEALPEPVRPLARRNAIEISHTRFDSDVQRLVAAIGSALGEPDAATTRPSRRARKVVLMWLAAGLAVLTVWLLLISPRDSKPTLLEAFRAKADTTSPSPRGSPGVNGPISGSASSPSSTDSDKPGELADLAVGTYDGGVSADSRGPSMSDVTVTIEKVSKRRVRITSDYARLGTVEVDLTRLGDLVMNAGGSAVVLLYLDKTPPQLTYNPGGVAYGGEKR